MIAQIGSFYPSIFTLGTNRVISQPAKDIAIPRFSSLDSWRGICACLVTFFHFSVYSHIGNLALIQNAYLFVDFFFVLSGFVIAANYQKRLLEGYSVGQFMLLRFGRIYPLHLFMLLCFVGSYTLLYFVMPSESETIFSSERKSISAIFGNLFLVHSLGIYDDVTWNTASWSISAEFYTYMIYAGVLLTMRKMLHVPLLIALIGCPLLIANLSENYMDTTADYGLIRCVYGFAAGALCFYLFRRLQPLITAFKPQEKFATYTEIIAILSAAVFVCSAGKNVMSVFAPYIFSAVVLIFSFELGRISALLKHKFLLLIGILSYSIYMVHVFIQGRVYDAGKVVGKITGQDIFTSPWVGDLACIIMLLTVLAVSYVTYRYIETPGRNWFKGLVKRIEQKNNG